MPNRHDGSKFCDCITIEMAPNYMHRALGILLFKMFADSTFEGPKCPPEGQRAWPKCPPEGQRAWPKCPPEGQRAWQDFHYSLQSRLDDLRARVGKDGMSEESHSHHVSLACGLIETCLQQQPEDRCASLCTTHRGVSKEVDE